MAEPAPSGPSFSFVEMEHRVLSFWAERAVFQKSLERTAASSPYIFYDGPPFATGLPHHGHIVASTITGFRNTLMCITNHDWFQAETQMLKSKWANQTPKRARRHAWQMRNGLWHQEYAGA